MLQCVLQPIKKKPPKWQENDLVSGGHGRAAKLGACVNWVDWFRTSADKRMWSVTEHRRDGAMSCCWLWLFSAHPSFLVDGRLGCWPQRVSPSRLQRTGRRAELLGVKLGFPRSRCRAIISDMLCMRSYVNFVCVCVYMCLCVCVRT